MAIQRLDESTMVSTTTVAGDHARLLVGVNSGHEEAPAVDPVVGGEDRLTLRSQESGNSLKLRGGYYTPNRLAAFLAEWAIQRGDERVLEPSAGDGAVSAAAAARIGEGGQVVAVEVDGVEAKKVADQSGQRTTVINADLFAWYRDARPDGAFDAVVGNPPFIRYQDFPEAHRVPAFALMREAGLKPSRLTNAWVPFVVVATRSLRPGGRLALVLPAELLQVGYAAELRGYLARNYSRITVVTFRQLTFKRIQQETVLLLGVRHEGAVAEMSFVELGDAADLAVDQIKSAPPVTVGLDHAREKWTQYYLAPGEIGLIREIEGSAAFGRLGDVARVDVGIVTGRNDFFVLTPREADLLGVRPWCVGLVGRSAQIPGLILRPSERHALEMNDARCLLLQLGDVDRSQLPEAGRKYVENGERAGYHEGYKCAVRLPRWWNVPSVWAPSAFLLRQIHHAPRIVENRAGVTSTDTIHRVKIVSDVESGWLAAASVNSLTFAFSEIRGRSYGGGVLELEPTEAEGLPFPRYDPTAPALPVEKLDSLIRREGVESALPEVDRLVLKTAGLSDQEIVTLRVIWRKLSDRRRGRNRRLSSH